MNEGEITTVSKELETESTTKVATEVATKEQAVKSEHKERDVKEEDIVHTILTGSRAAEPEARLEGRGLETCQEIVLFQP